MRTNYVLIDYENVQPENLSLLVSEHFRIIVFVGQSQPNIRTGLAMALQSLGSRAAYVRIEGNGPNALDFHIAYYIGRLAEKDKTAFFHVISRDTGFDPLIAHLKTRGIFAKRSMKIEDIPAVQVTTKSPIVPASAAVTAIAPSAPSQAIATAPPAHTDTVVAHMKKMVNHLPRTDKALSRMLLTWLRPINEADCEHVLQELIRLKIVAIDNGRVRYSLLT